MNGAAAACPGVVGAVYGDDPTAVYRFYGGGEALLYVGVTGNLRSRWAQHANEKPWWAEVRVRTVVWYGTRAEAFAAETRAREEERPRYNDSSEARVTVRLRREGAEALNEAWLAERQRGDARLAYRDFASMIVELGLGEFRDLAPMAAGEGGDSAQLTS